MGIVVLMFVITPIISVVLFTRESKNVLKIGINARRLYRVAIAGMISTALLVPLMLAINSDYILLLVLAAAEQLVVYPPVLSLVKGVSKKDLEVLKRITGHIPVLNLAVGVVAGYSGLFARD